MQRDDVVDEVSKLSIHNQKNAGTGDGTAAARLVAEASSFRGRGPRDITAEFTTASKQLKPGELVKDDFFTLFESVGALEIMDPKMDSGFVPPGDDGIQFDIHAPLTPEQVLGIIDQLIRHEMAWLSGLPLSQTLFTSLHIDALLEAPEDDVNHFPAQGDGSDLRHAMTHIVLRAYCVATITAIDLIREIIMGSIFYDEEDFVPHLYGREGAMLPSVTPADAEKLLDEANSLLSTTEHKIDEQVRQALVARIVWRRTPFARVHEMPTSYSMLSAKILEYIMTSHSVAESVPNAFSEKVQRHLATSTPPRPMFQLDWYSAMAELFQMHNDIRVIPYLTSSPLLQSPNALHRAIWAFANRKPGVYARAIMQAIITHGGRQAGPDEEGVFNISEACLNDMRDLVMAGDERADPASFSVEVPSDWRHQTSRILEDFIMTKAYEPFQDLYLKICQNRCRIRRYFTQAMQQWHDVQDAAASADAELIKVSSEADIQTSPTPLIWHLLRSTVEQGSAGQTIQFQPLTFWALYHKLQIMEWHVQMGFETDVYLQDEYTLMYAHLCYLSATRHDLVDCMKRALMKRRTVMNKRGNGSYAAEFRASGDWLRTQLSYTMVIASLSAALWNYCGALMASGVIKPPPRTRSQAQLQFEARMKPYLAVTNVGMQSAEECISRIAEESKQRPTYVDDQIKAAQESLAALKAMTSEQAQYFGTEEQWKEELKSLQQVCVAVKAQHFRLRAMMKGKQTLDGFATTENKMYNRWWVVPWIKEIAK